MVINTSLIWNRNLNAESQFKFERSCKFNGDIMSPRLYPARLHDLMMSSQPGLNLEHLLEDVLKWGKWGHQYGKTCHGRFKNV